MLTVDEFIAKVDYEGTAYAIQEYFSADDLDSIPDEYLREAALDARMALDALERRIDTILFKE